MASFDFRTKILVVLLPAILAASPVTAQTDNHFTENSSNGRCFARVWGGTAPFSEQRMVLEFGYAVAEGKLWAAILVYDWSRAQDADPDANIPMSLVFDSGTSIPSSAGGYDSDVTDYAVGEWDSGSSANSVLALLRTASTARIRFDGLDLGPFDIGPKGLIYDSLDRCAARLRLGR